VSETNKGEEQEMANPSQEAPVGRLGAAHLDEPVESLNPDTVSSFRAVPERSALAEELGPLNDLPGRWTGSGFNLIARPDFAQKNDIFLELNLTAETLEFSTIGSPIPNRGSTQGDIFLRGVTYLQQISDAKTNGALHIEPGIWLKIPPTTAPSASESVARLACVPHGDAVCAVGEATTEPGKPNIAHRKYGALPRKCLHTRTGSPKQVPRVQPWGSEPISHEPEPSRRRQPGHDQRSDSRPPARTSQPDDP
jgi:hypothetical protein